jgi:cardiolipin synthase (CMP-forming)
VTLLRLALVPVFVWLLLGREEPIAAALLLAVLGATDFVDGKLARRLGQVTTLGKVLDPVADRVLLVTAALAMVVDGAVPVWLAASVLVREVVVSGAVVLLAAMGASRVDVVWVGKAGTLALMASFPLFLVGHSEGSWHGVAEILAWLFGVPGLVLAWYAVLSYLPLARESLVRGRSARQVGSAT